MTQAIDFARFFVLQTTAPSVGVATVIGGMPRPSDEQERDPCARHRASIFRRDVGAALIRRHHLLAGLAES